MTVYVIGTADTKGAELNYAKGLIEAQGVSCRLVDVSTRRDGAAGVDVSPQEVAEFAEIALGHFDDVLQGDS